MRFLSDENIPAKLLSFLKALGHDVAAVAKGTEDSDVAALARTELRLILTHDTDFANADRHPASRHAGIILIRINPLYIDKIKTAVTDLLTTVPESKLKGHTFLVYEDTFLELEEGQSFFL